MWRILPYGEARQLYTRHKWVGDLQELGVEVIRYVRLFGMDSDSVYLQHISNCITVECSNVETLVLALGHQSNSWLEHSMSDYTDEVRFVGDYPAPRTAEEAVLEGLKVGDAS